MANQQSSSHRFELKHTHTKIKYDQRVAIYSYLDQHWTIPQIAKRLDVSEKTIRNEIQKGITIKVGYKNEECPLIENHKYAVCNQCPEHEHCNKNKKYYDLNKAVKITHENKHEAHEGTHLTPGNCAFIKAVVTHGLYLGQSIEVIWQNDESLQELCCPRTIRRMIKNGTIDIPLTSLRQTVQRRNKDYDFGRTDAERAYLARIKGGRTMTDYKEYVNAHPDAIKIQLDSIVGSRSDKMKILTIMFVKEWFQIGRIYCVKNQTDLVNKYINQVLKIIGSVIPKDTPITLLSDNGVEFNNIVDLEQSKECENEVHVFFTHAYNATDKSECERNHEYFRYVCPKHHTFEELTQDIVNNIFSNINSYIRKGLNYLSPCSLFINDYSKETIKKLGIYEIPSKDVNLSHLW